MRFIPAYRERRDAVRVPFFTRLLEATESRPQRGAMLLIRRRGQKILIALMWLSLVIAAAKPQWLGEPIEHLIETEKNKQALAINLPKKNMILAPTYERVVPLTHYMWLSVNKHLLKNAKGTLYEQKIEKKVFNKKISHSGFYENCTCYEKK